MGKKFKGSKHILFPISQIMLLIAQFRVIWWRHLAAGCELPHTQGQLRMFSFCWVVCTGSPTGASGAQNAGPGVSRPGCGSGCTAGGLCVTELSFNPTELSVSVAYAL